MMWPYFDLVTDRTPEEIAALADQVKTGAKHPMDVKMSLAKEIIAGFHGEEPRRKKRRRNFSASSAIVKRRMRLPKEKSREDLPSVLQRFWSSWVSRLRAVKRTGW